MNILFLTVGRFERLEDHGIYNDLLHAFIQHGHTVYSVSANEKRSHLPTTPEEGKGYYSLHVRTGNLTQNGLIEKGISMLTLGRCYEKAIFTYFSGVRFDLILYSTPPVTLAGIIKKLKKKTGAMTYLLLKDIFPQNAVDIGLMRTTGATGLLYQFFRRLEKKTYALSDRIGCMSEANVAYIRRHNPEIPPEKLELSPNCIEVQDVSVTEQERNAIREKYGLPKDKTVFVYGGNLGKPQDIPFIIQCLKAEQKHSAAFFLIIGFGTEYELLKSYMDTERPHHARLLGGLPHDDYEKMIAACDAGLIFLDHRFTIPNFPSRLLAYMQARLPVLACTDPHSDIGKKVVEGGFGWWCESSSTAAFSETVEQACASDMKAMGEKGYRYLLEHYTVERQYRDILKSITGGKANE